MRSFITLAAPLVALLAFVASPAQAADNRQLVNFDSSSQDATAFCNSWRCACINYVPKSADLTNFQSAYCQPGDFRGKNTDDTARVFCTWQHSDGSPQSIFKHTAAATNATLKA